MRLSIINHDTLNITRTSDISAPVDLLANLSLDNFSRFTTENQAQKRVDFYKELAKTVEMIDIREESTLVIKSISFYIIQTKENQRINTMSGLPVI